MATWRINNSSLLGGEVCAPWVPNHAYALGARVVCRIAYGTVARRAYVYECTTAGTSHASTEPTWPTSGTVTDGATLVWTCQNPNDANWDNASCILAYVLNHTAIAAGDSVFVASAHNENTAIPSWMVIKGSNVPGNPVKIYSVNKTSEALEVGAEVHYTQAGTVYLRFQGFLYSYGVTYNSDTYMDVIASTKSKIVLESNGGTVLGLTADTKLIYIGGTAAWGEFWILNGAVFLGGPGSYIGMNGSYMKFYWIGGSVIAPSGCSYLINGNQGARLIDIRDVDLSAVGSGASARSLVVNSFSSLYEILFSRCKLPSDAGFTIVLGGWDQPVGRVRLHHCSSANKSYDFHETCYEGTIDDEATIVRTGGASDGTTPQSWKMISSANVVDNLYPLKGPPIAIWNSAITEKTFTIECLYDSLTNLQNDEAWLELEYPANNTDGLGSVARDKCAILGTPADKSAGVGSGNWTTTGLTNPNSFKCAVTVTPGKAGWVTARICLAKPSTMIYVDPKITIS